MANSEDTTKSHSGVEHREPTSRGRRSIDSDAAEVAALDGRYLGEITAGEAHINRSAAARVRASLVDAVQSKLGLVRANEVWMRGGTAGAVRAETADLAGCAGVVAGNTVRTGKATAAVVVGREIHAEKIESLVVFGNRIEGEVHTVFDSRQAIMAGMLGGLLAGLILSLTRVLFRRD